MLCIICYTKHKTDCSCSCKCTSSDSEMHREVLLANRVKIKRKQYYLGHVMLTEECSSKGGRLDPLEDWFQICCIGCIFALWQGSLLLVEHKAKKWILWKRCLHGKCPLVEAGPGSWRWRKWRSGGECGQEQDSCQHHSRQREMFGTSRSQAAVGLSSGTIVARQQFMTGHVKCFWKI